MDQQHRSEQLAELRYLNQQVVRILDDALVRLGDGDVSDRVHRIRADHLRHIARIDDLFFATAGAPARVSTQFKEFAEELLRKVQQSRSQADLVGAVLEAERAVADRYRLALGMGVPAEAEKSIRRHYAEEREHGHYLERQVLVMAGTGSQYSEET